MNSVKILGTNIPLITPRGARTRLRSLLKGKKCSSVYTPNTEILYMAARDKNFRSILNSADLLIPDGSGVVAASRIIGKSLPCRMTGIETGEYLLRLAAKNDLPVFLLGGKEGISGCAALRLAASIKGLRIAGTHHGYFDRSPKSPENTRVCELINESGAAIVFVCLGAPLQERWIFENKQGLKHVRLIIGLGGSIDVWSGHTDRAPHFLSKSGFEWLYRALRDPRRFRRIPRLLWIPLLFLLKKKK